MVPRPGTVPDRGIRKLDRRDEARTAIGEILGLARDLGQGRKVAKALFILGRVPGLSAHRFQEVVTQPSMRRIKFAQAVYRGD